jgi:MFS family permease
MFRRRCSKFSCSPGKKRKEAPVFRFAHRPGPVEETSTLIQFNPQLKTYRQTRLLLLVSIAVLLVAMAGFQIWMSYLNTPYPGVPQSPAGTLFLWIAGLPILLLMGMSLLSNIRNERYWQRIETLRFAALTEDQPLLAGEQPSPDGNALPLPASLTTRINLGSLLANVLLFPALLGGYVLLSHVAFGQSWLSELPYLILMLVFVLVVVFILSRIRSTILVTADGVRIPGDGGHTWVSWHEMRLFACYRTQESLKSCAALTYELSTPNAIIRWTWLQRPGIPWNSQRPMLPFAEHTAQMKALAQYIIARTGLPLQDLSKGQVGDFAPSRHNQAMIVRPQQQRIQADAPSTVPSTLICSNPLLGMMKMMRLLYLGMMAFMGFTILFMHTTFYLSGLITNSGFAGFWTSLWSIASVPACVALLWLALVLLLSLIERYWKQLEHLRFSAAAGAEHLLSPHQPQPHADALHVPTTITLRIARSFAFFFALSFLISISLLWLLIGVLKPVGAVFFFGWPVNGIGLTLLVGLAWGFYLLFARRRTHIEVSDKGMTISQNKRSHAQVSWEEARLFACYSAPLARFTGDELVYELSSGSSVVRWSWVQRTSSPWLMWTATVPFVEHTAEMQALGELIAARTGLLLYDLRRE